MDRDLTWEQYQEKTRQELIELEKKASKMRKEKQTTIYILTHPHSGTLKDLINVNGDEILGKALLRYKTETNDFSNYDGLDSCNILEYLYCENSAYEIILESGDGIKIGEIDRESYPNDDRKVIDCEIQFYDVIPTVEELFAYLFDEESRYKIIRKKDNVELVDTTSKIRLNAKTKKLVR